MPVSENVNVRLASLLHSNKKFLEAHLHDTSCDEDKISILVCGDTFWAIHPLAQWCCNLRSAASVVCRAISTKALPELFNRQLLNNIETCGRAQLLS